MRLRNGVSSSYRNRKLLFSSQAWTTASANSIAPSPLLHQGQVLLDIGLIKWDARPHRRAAAVHLEGADRGHDDHSVRHQPGETTLQVPELLEADVDPEPALRHQVIRQPGGQTVSDDRALPEGYVGD